MKRPHDAWRWRDKSLTTASSRAVTVPTVHGDPSHQNRRRFLKILLALPAAITLGERLFGRDEVALADALLAASSPDSAAARSGRALDPSP